MHGEKGSVVGNLHEAQSAGVLWWDLHGTLVGGETPLTREIEVNTWCSVSGGYAYYCTWCLIYYKVAPAFREQTTWNNTGII